MEIKASVVIADASEEYRTILKKTMESTGEFQVVGSAGSGGMRCGWYSSCIRSC